MLALACVWIGDGKAHDHAGVGMALGGSVIFGFPSTHRGTLLATLHRERMTGPRFPFRT